MQQWLEVKWHIPQGWEITPAPSVCRSLEQFHCNIGRFELEFAITGRELKEGRYDLILEISSAGHHTKGLIPIVLLNRG